MNLVEEWGGYKEKEPSARGKVTLWPPLSTNFRPEPREEAAGRGEGEGGG